MHTQTSSKMLIIFLKIASTGTVTVAEHNRNEKTALHAVVKSQFPTCDCCKLSNMNNNVLVQL